MVLVSVISVFVGLGILQAIHHLRLVMLLKRDDWKLSGLASGSMHKCFSYESKEHLR